MTREEPWRPASTRGGSARRRGVALAALVAGWLLAAWILAPDLMSSSVGGRAAPALTLAAVLAWWAAVVETVRSDLRDFLIPDGASLATVLLGLLVATAGPLLSGSGSRAALTSGLSAAAVGAGAFALFWLVAEGFARFGREALGFGDVKLAGAAAVWLSPGDGALALEIAAVSALIGLLTTRRSASLRDTAVPFGAFMAPAAWLVFVLGPVVGPASGWSPW